MSDKKSSGCVVAVVLGIILLLVGGALVAKLMFRTVRAGKEMVEEKLEEHRHEEARAAEQAAAMRPVEFTEGELPEYARYRLGEPLGREMFLAWKADQGATTLAQEAFREKAEGAEVTWELRAGDLLGEGERIAGSFYLPYVIRSSDGRSHRTGVETVRCEFAAGERDSLLTIRRDHPATIRGRLSLKSGEAVLTGARRAGGEAEDVER